MFSHRCISLSFGGMSWIGLLIRNGWMDGWIFDAHHYHIFICRIQPSCHISHTPLSSAGGSSVSSVPVLGASVAIDPARWLFWAPLNHKDTGRCNNLFIGELAKSNQPNSGQVRLLKQATNYTHNPHSHALLDYQSSHKNAQGYNFISYLI